MIEQIDQNNEDFSMKTLLAAVNQWAKDEDAHIYKSATPTIYSLLDLEEGIWITSKIRLMHGVNKIEWRGLGVRRGVLFMGQPIPNWPSKDNWYVGFTTAGNGTPAGIFPVNNDLSFNIAATILSNNFI